MIVSLEVLPLVHILTVLLEGAIGFYLLHEGFSKTLSKLPLIAEVHKRNLTRSPGAVINQAAITGHPVQSVSHIGQYTH
jgi:hypothetical protein